MLYNYKLTIGEMAMMPIGYAIVGVAAIITSAVIGIFKAYKFARYDLPDKINSRRNKDSQLENRVK